MRHVTLEFLNQASRGVPFHPGTRDGVCILFSGEYSGALEQPNVLITPDGIKTLARISGIALVEDVEPTEDAKELVRPAHRPKGPE